MDDTPHRPAATTTASIERAIVVSTDDGTQDTRPAPSPAVADIDVSRDERTNESSVGAGTSVDDAAPADGRLTPAPLPDVGSASTTVLATELELARAERVLLVGESHAEATRDAYERDWRAFRAWCARLGPLDPAIVDFPTNDETLSLYVGALAARRPSTVRRAIAAIRLAHERAGCPALLEGCPATVAALRGHARRHAGTAPRRKVAAVATHITRMADTCDPHTPIGLRNRALLLVGHDLGVRRGELVALDVEDLEREPRGIVVTVRRSKGDQTGDGATLALVARPGSDHCPVAALERWLAARGHPTSGPVFVGLQSGRCKNPGEDRLSDRAVARVVKAAAALAGLAGDYGGHSLRRGMITDALDTGDLPHLVQRRARHRTLDTTLAYAERRLAFEERGVAVVGAGAEAMPDEEVAPAIGLLDPDTDSPGG